MKYFNVHTFEKKINIYFDDHVTNKLNTVWRILNMITRTFKYIRFQSVINSFLLNFIFKNYPTHFNI